MVQSATQNQWHTTWRGSVWFARRIRTVPYALSTSLTWKMQLIRSAGKEGMAEGMVSTYDAQEQLETLIWMEIYGIVMNARRTLKTIWVSRHTRQRTSTYKSVTIVALFHIRMVAYAQFVAIKKAERPSASVTAKQSIYMLEPFSNWFKLWRYSDVIQ